jgi:hypothetical protein
MGQQLQQLAARLQALTAEWGEPAARAAFERLAADLDAAQRQQLAALAFGDDPAVVRGEVQVSGTVHGAVVGVNQGTIQISQAGPTPAFAPAAGQAAQATPEQVAHQRQLLEVHRTTLGHYLTQLAIAGSAHARPEVSHGIREARAGISKAKAALRGWGVVVEDLPDDQ